MEHTGACIYFFVDEYEFENNLSNIPICSQESVCEVSFSWTTAFHSRFVNFSCERHCQTYVSQAIFVAFCVFFFVMVLLWLLLDHFTNIICAWFAGNYNRVIMSAMTSQITSLTIVYSTVYSGADKKNPQSSASLAFVCSKTCLATVLIRSIFAREKLHERFSASAVFQRKIERINTVARNVLL